jgi:hypothetical protein
MSMYGLSPGSICSLLTGVLPSGAVVVAVAAGTPVELVIELSAHADSKMSALITPFDNLDMSANLAMATAKGWAVWA